MHSKPLTPEEVKEAADKFFPLFDIVHRSMPENCTVEDSLKVMESVCTLAHKLRAEMKNRLLPSDSIKTKTKKRKINSPRKGVFLCW